MRIPSSSIECDAGDAREWDGCFGDNRIEGVSDRGQIRRLSDLVGAWNTSLPVGVIISPAHRWSPIGVSVSDRPHAACGGAPRLPHHSGTFVRYGIAARRHALHLPPHNGTFVRYGDVVSRRASRLPPHKGSFVRYGDAARRRASRPPPHKGSFVRYGDGASRHALHLPPHNGTFVRYGDAARRHALHLPPH
ncbi:hypothetical protein, partial [Alicyclobacillus acidiphilus]|uniref:hypothetical protein n=1 Tax=Alicyclobacillus acidiphilus TaxID=182455 RepID=UPI001C3F4C02